MKNFRFETSLMMDHSSSVNYLLRHILLVSRSIITSLLRYLLFDHLHSCITLHHVEWYIILMRWSIVRIHDCNKLRILLSINNS